MCGILGFSDCEGINNFSCEEALAVLAHRGPDARGFYYDSFVSFGHLRLSILDLSDVANQPMHSHCGRYIIVYNGEIYNYREIEADIRNVKPGFSPRTTSDTEIILEAFVVWGTDFIRRTNGMFAITIWDKLEKKLYLFRDRIGIKPIYFYHKSNVFAFASELKALTRMGPVKKDLTLDHQAVNQFLHLGYIPAPSSIYCQIRKFPQGSYGVFHNGSFQVTRWWDPAGKIQPLRNAVGIDEAVEHLDELVTSAVRYRLISDVPYGTFLSGGIDSSLVTAVAQSLHTEPVNTFNIGFWERMYDESAYARKIAEYLGTRHHTIQVTEKDAIELIPGLTDIYDEPFADSSAIPTLLVSQLARKHVTVTLSGDGGDELFMGYGAYRWSSRLANPFIKALRKPARLLISKGPSKYRRAASLFDPIDDRHRKSHIFSQEQYLFSRAQAREILLDDFKDDFQLDEYYTGPTSQLSPSEQQAFFDLNYYLPDDLLVKVDRASMLFGLETRVPLLDYRIVEWALNLPPQLKLRNGEMKWLLKQVLYRYVPREFFQRPKQGFAIPLPLWMKTHLKDLVMAYLDSSAVKKAGVLHPEKVNQLLNAFYTKDQFWHYNRIWQLLVLQKWLLRDQG